MKYILARTTSLSVLSFLFSGVARAEFHDGDPSLSGPSLINIFEWFLYIIDVYLIPIVFALALLFFLWGMAQFIRNAGDKEKIQEGKRLMVWGLITLFVMVSVWGIINLLQVAVFGGGGFTVPLFWGVN